MIDGDYNWQKECDDCDRIVCIDCVALTACQTTWGVCVDCFDYKCTECDIANLEQGENILYLTDCDPLPMCGACFENHKK